MDLAQLHPATGEILDSDGVVTEDLVENPRGRQQLGGQQQVGTEDVLEQTPSADLDADPSRPDGLAHRRASSMAAEARRMMRS